MATGGMHVTTRILERAGAICAGLLMLVLVLITLVDVIGRQFGYPLSFAFEFTQVTVGIMFYLVLPLVTLRREHIVVDLVPYREGARSTLFVDAFVHLLCALLLVVAARQLWAQGETLQMFRTVMMFTRWPVAPFVFVMSGFAALTAAVLLLLSVASARRALGRSPRGTA